MEECKTYMDSNGRIVPMTKEVNLTVLELIEAMANEGLCACISRHTKCVPRALCELRKSMFRNGAIRNMVKALNL